MEKINDEKLKQDLSFDLYGRYAIIRDIINNNRKKDEKFRVLDVGGRGNLLKDFLPNDDVFYLDPLIDSDDENFIKDDGCSMSLESESFDWVTSSDVFEHIPLKKREAFLSENIRVARIGAILAAPFWSKEVEQAEINANENYKKFSGGIDHEWLKEHIENGLPIETEVERFLKEKGFGFQKLYNNRLFLWETIIGINFFVWNNFSEQMKENLGKFNYFYNSEVFPNDSASPSYRKIYFIKKHSNLKNIEIENKMIDDVIFLEVIKKGIDLIGQIDIEIKNNIQAKNLEIQQKIKEINFKSEELKSKVQEIEAKDQDIKSKIQETKSKEFELKTKVWEIEYMKSSKFWRIKTFYEKFKYPVFRLIGLINKSFFIIKKNGLLFFFKTFFNFLKNNQKIKNFLKKKPSLNKAYCLNGEGSRNENIILSIENFIENEDKETILLISHDASATGAPMTALNIAKKIRNEFGKKVIIILIKGGQMEGEFEKYGLVINLNQKSNKYIENYSFVNSIFRKIKNGSVINCICNTAISGILIPVLKENNFEYINLIHELSGVVKTSGYEKSVYNIINNSSKIVFATVYSKNDYIKNFGLNESNAIVRPQGLYKNNNFVSNSQEARDLLRKKIGVSKKTIIILGCGYASYHKGVDLFFDVAKRIYDFYPDRDIKFLWLGAQDKKIKNKLISNATKNGYNDMIQFCDFENEPSVYFAGSDVFLLTSREDTFPSVVLESMSCGVPVIAFDSAGGAPEILINSAGIVVPFLDSKKMADELIKLLDDRKYYNNISMEAKKVINSAKYNFKNYVGDLLSLFAETKNDCISMENKQKVKISVIIPNFNYERYLKERLNSIINQTIRPFEIIFLDDKSTDKSIEIAEKILSNSGISYKIIKNETNQGCFAQWIKGIKIAKGDLIWIAEADDLCKPKLLEALVPCFSSVDVVLAYCQSEIIDSEGKVMGFSYHEYTDDLSKIKWESSYVNNGNKEMNDGLAIKNTIPNASAVLMRKSALQGIENILTDYKMTGDWMTYSYVLRFGDIAYVNTILNSHRRHISSIIGSVAKYSDFFKELFLTQKAILDNFIIRKDVYEKMREHLQREYNRVGSINNLKLINTTDNFNFQDEISSLDIIASDRIFNQTDNALTIVVVIPNLIFGGGEIVAVEQANYLSLMNRVILYNARPYLKDELFMSKINSSVEVFESDGSPADFYKMCNSVLPDIVFSHIWWSDKLVWQSIQLGNKGFKWILTMHGCYEMLLNNLDCDTDFNRIVKLVLESADQVVYTADKNKEIFERKKPNLSKPAIKSHNGVMPKNIKKEKIFKRNDFNVEKNAFVFFLCSRAIPEKGWEESIQAFKNIKSMPEIKIPIHLFFIGDNKYAEDLKSKYGSISGLHFLGNRNDLHLLIPMFDACLLPTYFKSESQPMIIIESLMQDKPVIATSIGEIPQMLENGLKKAGLLVPLINNRPDMRILVNYMIQFINNESGIYTNAKKDCADLSKKFNIKNVMENYFEIVNYYE